MPPPIPTATVTIAGKDQIVTFDFGRLVKIEEATGRTCLQVLSEFAGYAGEEKASDAARLMAAERFSVRSVVAFVGACLDVPAAAVGKSVGMSELRGLYLALAVPFADAIRQLNGVADETPDPQPAPASPA